MNTDMLASYNPWWRDGRIPARYRGLVERLQVPGLVGGLSASTVTGVLGMRRVGKTVLVHQAIERLLAEGVSPRRIVYFSADDVLLGEQTTLVPDVLGFLGRQFPGAAGEVFVFVDEVHAIPDWPRLLKRYVDLGEPFVWTVTSSAGVLLHRGSTESLAGRVRTLRVLPFSPAEAAAFRRSPATPLLRAAHELWREAGIGPVDPGRLQRLQSLDREALGSRDELAAEMSAYLRSGGFPEYLALTDAEDRLRYFVETVLERVILVDIPAIAEIRNPALMRALLRRLISMGPAIVNVSELGRQLETTKITVTEYLRIAQAAMIDFILDRYSPSISGRQPGQKKSVPLDPGMIVSMGRWDMDGRNAIGNEGLLAEVAVHHWLLRHRLDEDITHWRKANREVDFVLSRPDEVLPIEVKWRDASKIRGLNGLRAFTGEFPGSAVPLVVTRDTLDVNAQRACVPLWMLG